MEIFNFTKKKPKSKTPDIVHIDHNADSNDTALFVPGKGHLPLIGPTSGFDFEELKRREQHAMYVREFMLRELHKNWQCTQCKRIWRCRFDRDTGQPLPGQTTVIIEWAKPEAGGEKAEVLVCPYVDGNGKSCRGPVVEFKERIQ